MMNTSVEELRQHSKLSQVLGPDYVQHSKFSQVLFLKHQSGAPSSLKIDTSSQPKFSYGKQLDVLSPQDEDEDSPSEQATADWLALEDVLLRQDLETSKKELELIRFALEETQARLRTEPSQRLKDRKALMGGCLEYASSRCHMLKERLRRVQFWQESRLMGRDVPERVPEEWRMADAEWRKWLSDQAAARADSCGSSPIDLVDEAKKDDIAWRIWGSLPYLLAAYIGGHPEPRAVPAT
ncbi:hypothetical protein F4780DRAFT_792638 [Xylariomycetidae sp. FL0641]|nr:hypothetical protein F4780DRAFT_792638 [Xylariomycetidae sp. FL0641]